MLDLDSRPELFRHAVLQAQDVRVDSPAAFFLAGLLQAATRDVFVRQLGIRSEKYGRPAPKRFTRIEKLETSGGDQCVTTNFT